MTVTVSPVPHTTYMFKSRGKKPGPLRRAVVIIMTIMLLSALFAWIVLGLSGEQQ